MTEYRGQRRTVVGRHAVWALVSLSTLAMAAGCRDENVGDAKDVGRVARVSQALDEMPDPVLINQLGYLPGATKIAVVLGATGTPATGDKVEVLKANGQVATGGTFDHTKIKSKAADTMSGDAVHHADFSGFTTEGTGYKVRVTIGGTAYTSGAFNISNTIYGGDTGLAVATWKMINWKRSGFAVPANTTFNIAGHAASHTGDNQLGPYPGSATMPAGPFDVNGGWYDAGDNGKYLESHTAATFFLANTFERMKGIAGPDAVKIETLSLGLTDSTMPDVLDEIAWGTRWVMGTLPKRGTHVSAPTRIDLVMNKCTSNTWPPYPVSYEGDTTPRSCMGPSTSATHSAVRDMAHVSRLLKPYGSIVTKVNDWTASYYADELWGLAKEAFGRATGKHPDYPAYTGAGASGNARFTTDLNLAVGVESPGFNVGSGGYADEDMADDEYSAAVELYLTACARADATAIAMYKPLVTGHMYYKQAGWCDWGSESALADPDGEEKGCGTLSLLTALQNAQITEGTASCALPAADVAAMKQSCRTFADGLIAIQEGQNYPSHAATGIDLKWGSNGAQAGAAALLVAAYQVCDDATHPADKKYLRGAARMMDYLLGVNPMKTSYIIGYGAVAAQATHDRAMGAANKFVYGTMVGGPLGINGGGWPTTDDLLDDLAARFPGGSPINDSATPKSGVAPLKRYARTDGGSASWESKENAINWEASLAAAAWSLRVFGQNMGCSTADECNDSNDCTSDTCSAAGVCTFSPANEGGTCNDGNVCTDSDKCANGSCVGTNNTVACADDGSTCTNDVCSGGVCTHPVTATCGGGCGITAEYFSGMSVSGTPVKTQVESTINADWLGGAPAGTSLPIDGWSVRWTGKIKPLFSETYTFTETSDDGGRLWIGATQVINDWTDHAAEPMSGTIALTAGQLYDIKYEFYENGGDAAAKLEWSSANQAKQVIPTSQLSPVTGCGTGGSGGTSGSGGATSGGASSGGASTGGAGGSGGGTTASCSDGIQNQTETGIDCGGPCLKCTGATCAAGTECKSSYCVDGYCCNTACAGGTSDCQACNKAGSLGTCSSLTGTSCNDGNATNCNDVCTNGTCAGSTCAVADPVARYFFDGDANDSSGNAKNATLVNGPTFVTGKVSSAVNLAGGAASTNSQHVTLPSAIVQGCTDLTVAAWVNLNANSADWTRIFDFGSGTGNYMFLTPRGGGASTLRFAIKVNNGTEQQISYTYTFPTATWKHVAVTLSGNTGKLYLDGAEVSSNTSLTNNPVDLGATPQNYLGKSQWPDPFLNGKLDEVLISCRAYSASEIQALASTSSGCANDAACGDNDACTTDTCNTSTGVCSHAAVNCNDGNACTTDSCNVTSGCVNAPLTCNDSDPCTSDSCSTSTGCVYTDNGSCTSYTGSGTISWDRWDNLTGTSINTSALGTTPSSSGTFTSFEAPSNASNSYQMRVRGYLTAPTSGAYTFYIASDDNGVLSLSTDDTEANKTQIASVTGYTGVREWTKFTSQTSASINLTGGQEYYIEAVYKEGTGGDNMAVGWKKPGMSTIEVIPGTQLSPYSGCLAPAAPTGVTASGGVSQATISWSTVSGATYTVKRSTSATGTFSQVASGVTGTQWTNSPVDPGTYYYKVVAVTSCGNSLDSGVSGAATVTSNTASTVAYLEAECGTTETGAYVNTLTTETGYSGSGHIKSSANTLANPYDGTSVDGATYSVSNVAAGSYKVWFRVDTNAIADDDSWFYRVDNGTWAMNNNHTASADWTWVEGAGGAITLSAGNHTIEIANRENGLNIDKIALLPSTDAAPSSTGGTASNCATTPSCSDGVKNGTETDIDCGGSCTTKCVDGKACSTGTDCANGDCVSSVCCDKLAAPGTPSATAVSGQATISWPLVTGAETYNVKRSTTSGTGYSTVSSPTTSPDTNGSLINGTTYYYVVSSVNTCGAVSNESANSSQVAVTPQAAADTTAPTTPGSPSTSNVTSSSIQLTWTASTDAVGVAGYRVYRNSETTATATLSASATSYIFTGLTASTAYTLKVEAYDAAGNTSAKASASAATSAATTGGCATVTTLTGDASVSAPPAGACYRISVPSNKKGTLLTAMNSGDAWTTVKWYGSDSEAGGACMQYSVDLSGNGAQINNKGVDRYSDGYATVFVKSQNTTTYSVSLSFGSWNNGTTCSADGTVSP